jgi:hypothetical protein
MIRNDCPLPAARPKATGRRTRLRLSVVTLAVGAVVAAVCVAFNQAQAAPSTADNPIAYLEPVAVTPGHASVHGWAFDPNAPTTPLTVDITLDGKTVTSPVANLSRPDVATAYAKYAINDTHGFTTSIAITDGSHTVCILAHNVGAGANTKPGCRTLTAHDSPFAHLEALTLSAGHITAHGWAFDPNAPTTPLTVDITLDGKTVASPTANVSRPDVAKAFASYGIDADHGYSTALAVVDGKHTVCVIAHNVSFGANTKSGCFTVSVHDSPYGHLEPMSQQPGHIAVHGWAFDPNAPTTPLIVDITLDGKTIASPTANVSRPDVAKTFPAFHINAAHGYSTSIAALDGAHTVCVNARNVSAGTNVKLGCSTITLKFEPTTSLATVTATATGVHVAGWTSDPDTSAAIKVKLTVDGHQLAEPTANTIGASHSGHNFSASLTTKSGTHTVCATGVNVAYGTHAPTASCKSVTLHLSPIGHFDTIARAKGSTNLVVIGWATDPDTSAPIKVSTSVDGNTSTMVTAQVSRPDVQHAYPAYGAAHGFSLTLPANDGEHTVCINAVNVSLGANHGLGCKEINAVHPKIPTAPRSVKAVAGYGGATVSWTAPASDGGAPWSSYVVTSAPGNISVTVGRTTTNATVLGLSPKTSYTFRVVAKNIVGASPAGTSAAVTTQAAPPPQTSPAPVSTSRYIRNIHGAASTDLAAMNAEGAADARANPSGHGYLVLLDIGGQDNTDGGVVLSATTRFVSYANLVSDLKSYVAGYASAQKASAPVTIAIGTNNDMEVTSTAGAAWADRVVDPIAAYAHSYPGITIAGANDIEPGFRGTYAQTNSWLGGYFSATGSPFVFNGSADGCAWTTTNRGCNNGWSMAGLYHLAAGAAPVRTLNLPQIYNSTMAAQWKYISLTGIGAKQPRINFGGALTEWTACGQASSCFSLTGNQAWKELWNQLRSSAQLLINSLPYSTDLRIDK